MGKMSLYGPRRYSFRTQNLAKGIKVDMVKIKTIKKLPCPVLVKAVKSFLDHAGFYKRFIKDFSKITRPFTKLLGKDDSFDFNEDYLEVFNILKNQLINAQIMVAPDWNLPFELMRDVSDYAIGVVLGQRRDKQFQPIYYTSKTLTDAQENYKTMEKELFVVVCPLTNFAPT